MTRAFQTDYRPLQKLPPLGGWPPSTWVEVFSRADSKWMPVDPVRYIVNKKKLMEPPSHDENNRMSYVVALEEDGYARDVTRRYASEYQTKTLKTRVGVRNGQEEWWSQLMSMLARPYRLVSTSFPHLINPVDYLSSNEMNSRMTSLRRLCTERACQTL